MKLQTESPAPPSTGRPLLDELQRIYGKTALKTDHFGRRQALPGEIERVIKRGTTGKGWHDGP